MTLILATLNKDFALVASDRRLTQPDGAVIEEESCKLTAFSCNGIHMYKSVLLIVVISVVSGCSSIQSILGINYSNQQRSVSSVVDYLYPNKRGEINIETKIPDLVIPLKVGIAFVPDNCGSFRRHDLNEELKRSLLGKVADRFKSKDIISKVEVIPSSLLKRKGSFTNLRQIKKDLDIDIVVLLSYDQVQYTERNFISMAYHWSIVGRYVFKGDKNDTITIMNAAVYDIASEEMLFRSEATSKVNGNSASAFIAEELRTRSQKGFKLASEELSKILDWDLYQFKQKIKKKEVKVKVSYRRSYGGGSLYIILISTFLLILGLRNSSNRRRSPI